VGGAGISSHLGVDAVDAAVLLGRPEVILNNVDEAADAVEVLDTAVAPRRVRPLEDVESALVGDRPPGGPGASVRQGVREGVQGRGQGVEAADGATLTRPRRHLAEPLVGVRELLLTLAEPGKFKSGLYDGGGWGAEGALLFLDT
jgi:hypothetical protein